MCTWKDVRACALLGLRSAPPPGPCRVERHLPHRYMAAFASLLMAAMLPCVSYAGKITAMAIPHPMCPLDSCKTRHPLGAPHASSGGKKIAVEAGWLVEIEGVRCKKCEHEWIPRPISDKPVRCPSCMSRNWNKGD